MYEHRSRPPIPSMAFAGRMLRHAAAALGFLSVSLVIGMVGYEYFEGLSWRDAFLNAAMLMGGMGPVDAPHTPGGKLFAGFYALYAGLGVLAAAGLMFTPMVHRILHKFHWEEER